MSPSTIPRWLKLVREHGSDFTYHRDIGTAPCPCRTSMGSRDPELHLRWKGGIESVIESAGFVPPGAMLVGPSHDISLVEYQMFMSAGGTPVGPPAGNAVGTGGSDGVVFITLRPFIVDAGYATILFRQLTNMLGQPAGWQNLGEQPISSYFDARGWPDTVPANFNNPADPDLIPTCNPEGFVTNAVNQFTAKGFIQPVQSGAVRRLTSEQLENMFGEVQTDDHIGILPIDWNGRRLDFLDWSQSTADYVLYNGRKFTVVSTNLLPDPADGNPEHHWEIGLRLIDG